MSDRTRLGLWALAAAAALGVLGDGLLRVGPWGLNFALWAVAAMAAAFVLARVRRGPLALETRPLLGTAAAFAMAFAWRDSMALRALNACGFVAALALAALRTREGRIRVAGIAEYAYGVAAAAMDSLWGGFALVFQDVEWSDVPRDGAVKHLKALATGLLVALPIVAVFGALLMNADAVFSTLIRRTFSIDAESVASHLVLIGFVGWVFGGFARGVAFGKEFHAVGGRRHEWFSLGIVEVGTVLALLDLLFLSFVVVQLRYLFGGDPMVQVTPNLTYADYARRGFFELVAVAALTLPLLLGAHWVLRTETPWCERAFRGLSWLLVGLLAVIMVSASQRMRLYQQGYGLTELRVYVSAFMAWLAVVFVWFGATVLRGQRPRFALGAAAAAFAGVFCLNAMNPDALIVRVNVQRAAEGKRFDAGYNAWLSADAIPELTAALPRLRPDARAAVLSNLANRVDDWPADWRTWNWGRATARGAVARAVGSGQSAVGRYQPRVAAR